MDHPTDDELPDLHCDPSRRRWFLLLSAMKHLPLHAAIELVERTEAFLATGVALSAAETGRPPCAQSDEDIEPAIGAVAAEDAAPIPGGDEKRSREPVDTAVVLGLLADGVGDGEIMAKFGLTKRQLLGFRLQMGREEEVVPAEEVVRFLRQQGDVVVGRADDGFLVNGRFRLTLAELVARANRIRARQGKRLLRVLGSCAAIPVALLS